MFTRTVIEHVAQMCLAFRAFHFCSHHAQAHVAVFLNVLFGNRSPKTRPTSVGFELGLRRKQHIPAADAFVQSVLVIVQVLARERPLRAFSARNFKLFRRKLFPSVGIGLLNLFHFPHSFALTGVGKLHNLDQLGAFGECLRKPGTRG
jgi:hypothetical protein